MSEKTLAERVPMHRLADHTKPLVFLDIDGVLNGRAHRHEYRVAQGEDPPSSWDPDRHVHLLLDERCVWAFNAITCHLGADIVVSSSWRTSYWDNFEELVGLLRRAGVLSRIISRTWYGPERRTGMNDHWQRGEEVRDWVRRWRPNADFLVLDDREDFDLIREHHYKTDDGTGLTIHDVLPAIQKTRSAK